jgi:hypothetical protein
MRRCWCGRAVRTCSDALAYVKHDARLRGTPHGQPSCMTCYPTRARLHQTQGPSRRHHPDTALPPARLPALALREVGAPVAARLRGGAHAASVNLHTFRTSHRIARALAPRMHCRMSCRPHTQARTPACRCSRPRGRARARPARPRSGRGLAARRRTRRAAARRGSARARRGCPARPSARRTRRNAPCRRRPPSSTPQRRRWIGQPWQPPASAAPARTPAAQR